MTGSGLLDFIVTLIVLGGIAAMFFLVIDKVSPDATFTKLAKVAIGVVILIVLILAVKAVLFGGGPAVALSGHGLIMFAIGAIVVLVVLYLLNLVLDWFGAQVGLANFSTAIKYVIAACALIALLVVADSALFGGAYIGGHALIR